MPWKKLLAWATGQIDDALRQKLEFVLEENRVYRALLGRHSPHWRLQDAERKVLAEKGKPLGQLLGEVITLVQPETPLKWHRQLVASKWDFSRRRKAKPGRPSVSVEIERLVLQLARENPGWGYDRIVGALANLRTVGVQPLKLPPQSPNLNAFAERWVRAVKDECLDQLILFGERSLRHALDEYLAHHQHERNHQGLDNLIPFPDQRTGCQNGSVCKCERLGGLLNYYHRAA